jgi:hypothetical protein
VPTKGILENANVRRDHSLRAVGNLRRVAAWDEAERGLRFGRSHRAERLLPALILSLLLVAPSLLLVAAAAEAPQWFGPLPLGQAAKRL